MKSKKFKMIKMFREKAIHIHTNGSYKSKEWWTELNKLLTEKDVVIFGLDGLGEENKKYRVNADWKSIEIGQFIFRSILQNSTVKILGRWL